MLSLILLFISFHWSNAFLFGRMPKRTEGVSTKLPYKTMYFTQRMDHFNYQPPVGGQYTYQQRVLFNDVHWKSNNASACPGPILFYTGNESPVTDYWDNSGFIIDVLAPKLGANIIFAEHRYFGKSLPYGNKSFDAGNIGYLSPEQALADYAHLLQTMKDSMPYDCPVFSFGGSYGGMLTTFFRTKYPWIVMGGLAASAPLAFPGTKEYKPYAFMDSCEETYRLADNNCPTMIQQGLLQLAQMGTTASGRAQLSQKFHLCSPLKTLNDALSLSEYFQGALVDMSMLDYPYRADYGVVFPAWPVNSTCAAIAQHPNDLIAGLSAGLENFYNATGTRMCLDPAKDQPDWGSGPAWPYLSCTGMTFITAQRGMWYPHSKPNISSFVSGCKSQFGVESQPFSAATRFGGMNLQDASNIIFSNGLLDPWHSDGFKKSLKPSLPAIVIPEAAHHLDLRGPHANDPIYITKARLQEEFYISKWIKEWFKTNYHLKDVNFKGDWTIEKDMPKVQFE